MARNDDDLIRAALDIAVERGRLAALAVWERDGKTDRGSCGGAVLEFDRRSKVLKIAIEKGIASRGGMLHLNLPEGVRSQNADIPQAQVRAFAQSLNDSGFGSAVARSWYYVD